MRDLSQAIFALIADDVAALKQHHSESDARDKLTPQQLEEKGAKYWALRCRRSAQQLS
jgi:hypothetical protein